MRKILFLSWWKEISSAHAQVPDAIVFHIWARYELITRYEVMESPFVRDEDRFDSDSNFDVQAALCGFFRRSAKGTGEADRYDPNDLNQQANQFTDMLLESPKLLLWLKGNSELTTFGEYILSALRINKTRNRITKNIVQRQELSNDESNSLLKMGFKVNVAKRRKY